MQHGNNKNNVTTLNHSSCSTAYCTSAYPSTAYHSTAYSSTAFCSSCSSTAYRSTAWHSTVYHSTAYCAAACQSEQLSTACCCDCAPLPCCPIGLLSQHGMQKQKAGRHTSWASAMQAAASTGSNKGRAESCTATRAASGLICCRPL